MFTGIVEELGSIRSVRRGQHSSVLSIAAKDILSDLKVGDSVAVNGVCLTATTVDGSGFTADVMHETLNRSSLGNLTVGSHVNLERAMAANGRFGGHIVSGHIDGTGTITALRKDDNAVWYTISASQELLRYIVEKGSIAIDGISLTVVAVGQSDFEVSIIPHTGQETILLKKEVGETVNLENDIVAKYVQKILQLKESMGQESRITEDFLAENGFL